MLVHLKTCPADHVWIDHCELYNEFEAVDKDYSDILGGGQVFGNILENSWFEYAGVGKLDISTGTRVAGPSEESGPVMHINPNPVTGKGYIEFTSDGEKAVTV